jgi:hypothetical protein
MKKTSSLGIIIVLLFVAAMSASGQAVGKVVGVEAGYGYITSSQELNPLSPHGLLAGLRYGYLILDRPTTSAMLSLALGYNWFPMAVGGNSLQALVYGLEYEHIFFRQSWIALALEYGLLFNLLLEDGRQGYAFGHHTRLGLGPVFRLGERDELVLLLDYNIVSFPYFEQPAGKLSFPSVALRYQLRF